jgi:serine/threonine protein kinase
MLLAAGARLGSFEVLSPIGAGGMGEVYHARDTKLRRDVAIKALPEDFYRVEERVARFRREAELLAALNHPNVAAIHGLEEIDGRTFLVMELVEGETLADRIAHGPIPTREALPLFVQIAEGLSAAHEKGIVHRDLKPANIQISPEDRVKILDFGLAKAFAGDGEPADSSKSPELVRSPFFEGYSALSPDGRWMAYASDESGRREVYLQPFRGAGGKRLVSTQGGTNPVWSPRGDYIYYLAASQLMSVDFQSVPSPKLGRPETLFRTEEYRSSNNARNYDIHPDGNRFLFIRPERRSDQVHVVLNWFDELKRLAPRN